MVVSLGEWKNPTISCLNPSDYARDPAIQEFYPSALQVSEPVPAEPDGLYGTWWEASPKMS